MANREMTGEQREELRAQLAKTREIAGTNQAGVVAPGTDDEALLRSVPVEAVEAAARRQRLLGDLDAETAALFSDEELEKIEAEERARAAQEQKKLAVADVRATARQRARVEHDLISPSVLRSEAEQKRLAEPVRFRIQVPNDGAGHHGRNGIRVDGRLYQAGTVYEEPRIVYESLLPNMYRALLNETAFRTLDQHKRGGSAVEVLSRTMPQIEVLDAR